MRAVVLLAGMAWASQETLGLHDARSEEAHLNTRSEAHPDTRFKDDRGAGRIAWTPCTIGSGPYGTIPGECGHLPVPLDYTDNHSATLDLRMVRYPASKKKRGTVFVNFGGPGVTGLDTLPNNAERIQE